MFCNKVLPLSSVVFFFNDTATTEIYTLSLHDALPISPASGTTSAPARRSDRPPRPGLIRVGRSDRLAGDRKSTRLNSSHTVISYAVFCLKKKRSDPGRAKLTSTAASWRNEYRQLCRHT